MGKKYSIGVYNKKNQFIANLRGWDGQILTFDKKSEAQTTANIESTQMEGENVHYKVILFNKRYDRALKRR